MVGTQTDLKDDQKTLDDLAERGLAPISTKMGQRKAKEIKAIGYIECTAKDIKSVVAVFRTACEFLLEKDKKRLQKINKGAKKEAKYAEDLDWRVKGKDIKSWERQKKISLDVNGKHIANYYIDFVIHHNDGSREYVEVKGFATEVWRLKWKLFEALIDEIDPGMEITVVR